MTPIEYAAGWRRDPDDAALERYWDGSAWTDRVRPSEAPVASPPVARPPEHVPQLHRALAEATTDIDAVEDRLSDLFERTHARATQPFPVPGAASPASPASPDPPVTSASAVAPDDPDD
ncbi:MAG TPA: DUF2510 domain-containing protein, partial [Acidimicrobiales bacterium]|nr:DUF2510 domain-containing protein [Acidimicrobiales bacterium]